MGQVMENIDGVWQRRKLTVFDKEQELQQLIVADPGLVPGCAGAAAVDELPIPGVGSLDIAMVDELGVITLVECKLRANPQIRREVVGQILAYASGLQGLSLSEFGDLWARRTKGGSSLLTHMQASATTGFDEEDFHRGVSDSLSSGGFRLVVAVDEITDELRAIIEYLAGHFDSAVKIMALEVGLIVEGEAKLLVLETYGQTFAPPQSPQKSVKKRWSRSEVDDAADALPVQQRAFVRSLLDDAVVKGARFNGGVGRAPSAGFYYQVGNSTPSLWSLYLRPSGAVVSLNIGSVANASTEAGEKYRDRATSMAGGALGLDNVTLKAYPEVPVQTLVDEGVTSESLIELFNELTGGGD